MLLKKIVVAEDDDAIAHLVNMALGDAGFLCLRAKDGDEAINLVRFHSPDLLVLDVMMPRIDGIEVARRIRADVIASRTPILMLTALTGVDQKVEGFEAGADDYLTKPFDMRELHARVSALIRASRRERERNPTTNLPGSGAIDDQINRILDGTDARVVLHVDVARFDTFADAVGYARANELVASMGEFVLQNANRHSDRSAFVGHMGGTDFIIIAVPDIAEPLADDLVAEFDRLSPAWVKKGADGDEAAAVRLHAAVGMVSTEGMTSKSHDELADRLAAALRVAKQGDASRRVMWRPDLEAAQ